MRKSFKYILRIAWIFLGLQNGLLYCQPTLKVTSLRCENIDHPEAIDLSSPNLSWQISSNLRNKLQSAYQILVSESEADLKNEKGNVWDSGKMKATANSICFPSTNRLKSKSRYFWKVRVSDENDKMGDWSSVATFATAYMDPSEWKALWIGTGEDQWPDSAITTPAPYFRKIFRLEKRIRSARISVCGLGFYELYLNGKKIGNQVLAPAQTNYGKRRLQKLIYHYDDQSRQRVLYNTFDVTDAVSAGENVIGMILGNGWFNQRDRTVEGCMWYDTPRLICQLEIVLADGTKMIIPSDASWKVITGPILHDGIFTGEFYDARRELTGWEHPGYDDRSWSQAKQVTPPIGQLQSQLAPYDKVVRKIRPILKKNEKPATLLYDCKEMISGWARIKMHGEKGDTVKLKFIEELGGDYRQLDTYIMKGAASEIYEPRFTWHSFREIEISGLKYQPAPEEVEVCVVNTDVGQTGHFSCSDPLLNQIYNNYIRTQLGNLHGSISSDCPHRERLGYTGDGQVAVEAAILSFDVKGVYEKWLLDMEDARNHVTGYMPHTAPFGGGGGGPAWGSAMVIIPWECYRYYGDKRLLEKHYAAMQSWVDYLGTRCDSSGIVVREEPRGWCLGDWATPEKIRLSPELVNTCYYYHVSKLLAEIAGILDKSADKKRLDLLADSIAKSINRRFYNAKNGLYLDGKQGANLFPLAFGIVPEKEQGKVFAQVLKQLEMTNYHFDTGILATPLLLKVLSAHGRTDLAIRIMQQKDFPSFGDAIINHGATTLWENWNGKSSHSHPMYGSVTAWFFNTLAGISPDGASGQQGRYLIKPYTGNELSFATASYVSRWGKISSSWKKEKDGLAIAVEIPVNTSAVICLPATRTDQIKENGKLIKGLPGFQWLSAKDGNLQLRIGSGSYHFFVRNLSLAN